MHYSISKKPNAIHPVNGSQTSRRWKIFFTRTFRYKIGGPTRLESAFAGH